MGSSFSLETLLQRYVASNDEGAMAELVARTRPRLLAAARRIWHEDAEDAVQSAYLSLVRRRDAAVPVHPWLLTAVIRLSYRRRAKAQRLQALVERLAPRENVECPIATAIGREEAELLRFEVWKLPDTYRDALVLRYLQGLSITETAQLLQLNVSTLRTHLQRGRRLLRSRVRILHPLLLVPWFLTDWATAATVTLGGLMKAKGTLAAGLILIASVIVGSAWLATREPDTARERAPRVAHHAAEPGGREPVTGQEQPEDGTVEGEAPLKKVKKAEEDQPPFAGGIVLDTASNPIEGVRVLARVYKLDVGRRRLPERIGDTFRAADPLARTDEGGSFRVDSTPAGLHSLVFLKRGFAAKEVICAENPKFDPRKGITHADVKRPGVGLRVVLDPGRSLTGVVETTDGQPLTRAGVNVIFRRGLWQQTQTDEQGRYALHMLAQEVQVVVAYAGGFERERRTEVGATADFRLRPRVMMLDVVDAVTRKLIPDARGMVVRDGRFFVTLQPGGSSFQDVRWVVPGRIYSLSSQFPDALGRGKQLKIQVFVFASGYLPWSDEVTLVHGETPPHLRVPLTPGSGPPAIAGHVRGSPTAHVEVQYAYLTGRGGARPLLMAMDTGATGRFSFSGLPAGKYILVARAEGRPEVVREVKAPVRDIVIDLRPGATLVVATKVANTMIHVETLEGGRFRKLRTNADGVATFEALAPGAYFVAAVIDGWDQSLNWRDFPKTNVKLKSGKASRIEVEVPRRQAVTFIVRDETGAPFSGVVLSLKPRRGIVSGLGNKEWNRLKGVAKTNDDGRVEVDLFSGEYDAELKFGTTTRIIAVEVPAKDPVEGVLLRGGITLKGTVRDRKTGRGLAKCWIYAFSLEERPKRLVDIRASQSGEFEVSGLSKPMIIIFRPLFAMVGNERVKYATGFLWLDGDRDEELDIRLPPANLPKPVKLDIQAQANARVSAYAWAGSCWISAGSAKADESGHVTLEAYDAPRYKVVVGKKGIEVERKGDRVVINVD